MVWGQVYVNFFSSQGYPIVSKLCAEKTVFYLLVYVSTIVENHLTINVRVYLRTLSSISLIIYACPYACSILYLGLQCSFSVKKFCSRNKVKSQYVSIYFYYHIFVTFPLHSYLSHSLKSTSLWLFFFGINVEIWNGRRECKPI